LGASNKDEKGVPNGQKLLLSKHPNMMDYKGPTGLPPSAGYHTDSWGGTHFKLALSLDTMSIIDSRIPLHTFKTNPPQPELPSAARISVR
jgi:hypothetical protein